MLLMFDFNSIMAAWNFPATMLLKKVPRQKSNQSFDKDELCLSDSGMRNTVVDVTTSFRFQPSTCGPKVTGGFFLPHLPHRLPAPSFYINVRSRQKCSF
jgi:hypothetical protein